MVGRVEELRPEGSERVAVEREQIIIYVQIFSCPDYTPGRGKIVPRNVI